MSHEREKTYQGSREITMQTREPGNVYEMANKTSAILKAGHYDAFDPQVLYTPDSRTSFANINEFQGNAIPLVTMSGKEAVNKQMNKELPI
jgi:hypothetical protein